MKKKNTLIPTTIKTDERVFQVHLLFDMGKKILCNLDQLEQVVSCSNGVNKIEHLWNGKFKRISKKDLKSMLEANKLNTEFLNLV